jgi:hypothetical protein
VSGQLQILPQIIQSVSVNVVDFQPSRRAQDTAMEIHIPLALVARGIPSVLPFLGCPAVFTSPVKNIGIDLGK